MIHEDLKGSNRFSDASKAAQADGRARPDGTEQTRHVLGGVTTTKPLGSNFQSP